MRLIGERETKEVLRRTTVYGREIHLPEAEGDFFRCFLQTRRQRCSQMETVSHRWKVASFLLLSVFLLSLLLPVSLGLFHFHAFSLLLLLAASDSIFSPCFIVPHFFSSIFPLDFFFFLFYSHKGNWKSLLQSICCHTEPLAFVAFLCFQYVFFVIGFISASTKATPPFHTHRSCIHSCPVQQVV